MNQRDYEKEFEKLTGAEKKTFADFFGSAIKKVESLGKKFNELTSSKKTAIARSVGAIGLAILIGAGMTACDKEATKPGSETTIVTNDYEDTTGSEKPVETEKPGGNENPGGTETPGGNENPGGTETPGGNENPGGTETPGENENPGGTETPGGNENPGGTETPGENENPGGTETPGGNENPGGTETPGGNENPGGTETPGGNENPGGTEEPTDPDLENKDLPADADGFAYDVRIGYKVYNAINFEKALPTVGDEVAKNMEPEILFVEVGERSAANYAPIYVYCAFPIENNQKVYAKFEFKGKLSIYRELIKPENYATYAQYATKMAEAIVEGAYVNAWEADATNFHEMSESQTTKLAAIIDDKFVDVDVNFVTTMQHKDYSWCFSISGFGYDEEGKAYSFTSNIGLTMQYGFWKDFIVAVDNEILKKENMPGIETQKNRIDSVFTAESQME